MSSKTGGMTITDRVLIACLALLFIIIVMGGTAIGAFLWVDRQTSLQRETQDLVEAASAISQASSGMVMSGMAGVISTGSSEYASALRVYKLKALAVLDSLGELAEAGAEGEGTNALADMRAALENVAADLEDAVSLAASDQAAALRMVKNVILPEVARLDELVNSYVNDELEDADAVLAVMSRNSKMFLILIVAWVAIAVVFAAGASVLIPRYIKRQVNSAVSSLGSAATELLSVASQVAASAAQTASSTSQATATIEEIAQTAMLAHEKASYAAEGAEGAVKGTGKARVLTEEAAMGIDRMKDEMTVVSDAIDGLSERAQAVGDLMTVVNDLAEQSNLLSVNASIEAAKAGDYGKGFTVVAQEVKSLAEQSKQAVVQARTILSEIDKASSRAVQAAEQGCEAVQAGQQKAVQVDKVMERMAERAEEDSKASRQAAASSQEQLAGMEQLRQVFASINQATTQAVSGTKQVQAEVSHLRELAGDIRRLIEAKAAEESEPS